MRKNKSPLLHIFILVGVMSIAGYLFYLLQQSMVLANRIQAEVNLLSTNQSRLSQLNSQMTNLTSEAAAWSKTLPKTEADVARFATFLEQIAKTQGLKMTIHFEDFPKKSVVAGSDMEILGTDIVLEGSFQGLTSFISQISGSNYFFKIDKLSIAKQETKPGIKSTLNGAFVMDVAIE